MKYTINEENKITITFTEEEAEQVIKYLDRGLKNSFEEAKIFAQNILRAVEEEDADKLYDLHKSDNTLLYTPYFKLRDIQQLKDNGVYTTDIGIIKYEFEDLIKETDNMEFKKEMKELVKYCIEQDANDLLKEYYLRELAKL